MKKLLSFLLFVAVTKMVTATAFFVSPGGNDSWAGTIGLPFKTLTKASQVLAARPLKGAGDTVFVRGGSYIGWPNTPANGYAYMLLNNLKGTALNPCVFINYPGEKPVFDYSNVVLTSTRPSPTGVSIFNSDYVKFKGMRFTGLKQITSGAGVSRGLELYNCNWCIIELIEIDHFGGTAFFGSNAVFDCTFKNCDAHHNDDRLSADGSGVPGSDAWDNADGFGFTGAGNTSDRITFDGNRAWLNCDDGWDNFGTNGSRIWKNCWAFWNGYYQDPGMPTKLPAGNGQGFKLGPCGMDLTGTDNLRVLQKCYGFGNRAHGFDQNGEVTTRMKLLNCTSYGNGGYGYQFQYYPSAAGTILHTIKNCASLSNGSGGAAGVNLASAAPDNLSNNSWSGGVSISSADFQSVSFIGADGPRQADGSLPDLPFLKLASGSDLIDAGINVGLPYVGSNPDIGADEFASAGPVNQAPTAGVAQATISIKLPVDSTILYGSGADADGTIVSYQWTQVLGPNSATIVTPAAATTKIRGLKAGTYNFQLLVTDDDGATAIANVQVSVAVSGFTTQSIDWIPSAFNNRKTKVIISWAATSITGTTSYEVQKRAPRTNVFSSITPAELRTPVFTAVSGPFIYKGTFPLSSGTSYYRIKINYTSGAPTYSAVLEVSGTSYYRIKINYTSGAPTYSAVLEVKKN